MTVPVIGLAGDGSVGTYPQQPPFDPAAAYPELARLPGGAATMGPANPVYALVREALAAAGYDRAHFGTAEWNPFGGLVPKAGLVVVKPNLVLESDIPGDGKWAVVTQGSVIRPLVDYIRLGGGADVEILIGDVPLQGADFDRVVNENGLRAMVEQLVARGDRRLSLVDLRREKAIVDENGFIARLERLSGDPRGYVEVDVGAQSRLEGLPAEHFEGFAVTDYRQGSTTRAHAPKRHVYLVPRSVLEASLIVNVPKLKTHQKAGLTVAIKNLVGINGDKARIPHFRAGGGDGVGDQYPPDRAWLRGLVARTQGALQGRSRVLYRAARKVWRSTRHLLISAGTPERAAGAATLVGGGAWYGNDTLWRALHDLNHILRFSDVAGHLQSTPQRHYICVVDGVVGGEGDGPLFPVPRRAGVVLAGGDPLAIDLVAARFMGLDWQRIPSLADAVRHGVAWSAARNGVDEGGIRVATLDGGAPRWAEPAFLPPPGWVGHVELAMPRVAV